MQTVEKPMSLKRKIIAMYAGEFYLRPMMHAEFIKMLERKIIVNDSAAVEFIEENGEWLSHVKA